jgi:hypothetical protein
MLRTVILMIAAVARAPSAAPAAASPELIVRCVPMTDVTTAITTLEIYRSRASDLGVLVTSYPQHKITTFVHLILVNSYVQALQLDRADQSITLNLLMRVGNRQDGVLHRSDPNNTENLRFVCDSKRALTRLPAE